MAFLLVRQCFWLMTGILTNRSLFLFLNRIEDDRTNFKKSGKKKKKENSKSLGKD